MATQICSPYVVVEKLLSGHFTSKIIINANNNYHHPSNSQGGAI